MSRVLRHGMMVFAALGMLAALVTPSHAQFTLYDAFAGGSINPNLWEGISNEGSFTAPSAEMIRTIDNSALHLKLVSYGGDTSNAGNTLSRVGVQFRDLGTLGGTGSIIGIKLKATVVDAVVQDCGANPDTGAAIRSRSQFLGWFFNDGTSTGATDSTGNIIAGIQLSKEADGSNPIQVFLQRCTVANCSTAVTPAGVTIPAVTSTWTPNTSLILKMRWDKVNGKVKFLIRDQLTQASENVVIDYQGIVPDAGNPANGDFKAIRLHNTVKNCAGDRKQVLTEAYFDNVNVQRQP